MPKYSYRYLNKNSKVKFGELGARSLTHASTLIKRRHGRLREFNVWESKIGLKPERPWRVEPRGKR